MASKGVLDIVRLVFDVMQTVSFMMFIEEEGIQIRGFGIMSLIREQLVDEVGPQVDSLEVQVNNLETFADSWGWMAPYVRPTYLSYVQAARDQIDAWRAWVTSVKGKEEKYGIRIYSSPTNAEIYVDDKRTDFLTPHTFYDLTPITHQFKLKYVSTTRGRGEYSQSVLIEKGKVKEVRWILTGFIEPPVPKDISTGIRIVSSPSNAEIWIDGKDTLKLTPQSFYDLATGEHTFELRYDSLSYVEKVVIVKDVVKEVRWVFPGFEEPPPKPPEDTSTGIRIVSSPSNAEIWIDGKDTEKLTPQSFYNLVVGNHTFLLRYLSTTKGLLVYAEKVAIVKDVVKEVRWVLEGV